jgi:large subunit ribosomal protein L21
MEAYAVVETGGKQYLLKAKDKLQVERLAVEAGQVIDLTPVLALSDGSKLTIGKPEVAGAKVSVKIAAHIRGPKIRSFKKRRRKGYARHMGHRQELTSIEVLSVS